MLSSFISYKAKMSELDSSEIQDIEIDGFLKKQRSNVFEMTVSWSDGIEVQLVRRYCDFASFHRSLLVQFQGAEEIKLPAFPTFQKLFHSVFDDSCYLAPDLDLLSDYCKFLLANLNTFFVKSFFEYSTFDLDFKRRKLSKFVQSETVGDFYGSFPQYLVIADYQDTKFDVEAGDVVIVIGKDCSEWNMVTYRKNREVKFGWIPNSYLILKEENDEIVEDIQSYLLAARNLMDEETAIQSSLYNASESSDVLKRSCCFFKYYLTHDAHLYCIAGDTIELKSRDIVVVIDKDTDGWWFVSCSKGEGWIVSTVLEPRRASLKSFKADYDTIYVPKPFDDEDYMPPRPYIVTRSYIARQRDELCLSIGEEVMVLFDSFSGWWTVKCPDEANDMVGLFPAIYLKRKTTEDVIMGRRYSLGRNSLLNKQPPPRRGSFRIPELDVSPSPPLVIPNSSDVNEEDKEELFEESSKPSSRFLPRRLQKHISLSTPSSPDLKPEFESDTALSDNEDTSLKITSKFCEQFPQKLLTPTLADRSPSIEVPLRKMSPIPLRFYRRSPASSPIRPSKNFSMDSLQNHPKEALSKQFNSHEIRLTPEPVSPVVQPVSPKPVSPVVQPVSPEPVSPVVQPVSPKPVSPVVQPVSPESVSPVVQPKCVSPESVSPVVQPEFVSPESVSPVVQPEFVSPESVSPVVQPESVSPESVSPVVQPVSPESVSPVVQTKSVSPESVSPVVQPESVSPESVSPVVQPESVSPESNSDKDIHNEEEGDIFHYQKDSEMMVSDEDMVTKETGVNSRKKHIRELKRYRTLGNVKFAHDVVIKDSVDIEEQKEKKKAGLMRAASGGGGFKRQKPIQIENNDSEEEQSYLEIDTCNDADIDSDSDDQEIKLVASKIKEVTSFAQSEKDIKDECTPCTSKTCMQLKDEDEPCSNNDYKISSSPRSPEMTTTIDSSSAIDQIYQQKQDAWSDDKRNAGDSYKEKLSTDIFTIRRSLQLQPSSSDCSNKSVDYQVCEVTSSSECVSTSNIYKQEVGSPLFDYKHTHSVDHTQEMNHSPSPLDDHTSLIVATDSHLLLDERHSRSQSMTPGISNPRPRHRSLSPTDHTSLPDRYKVRHHSISPTSLSTFMFPATINHSTSLIGNPLHPSSQTSPKNHQSLSNAFLHIHQRSAHKLVHESMHKR